MCLCVKYNQNGTRLCESDLYSEDELRITSDKNFKSDLLLDKVRVDSHGPMASKRGNILEKDCILGL